MSYVCLFRGRIRPMLCLFIFRICRFTNTMTLSECPWISWTVITRHTTNSSAMPYRHRYTCTYKGEHLIAINEYFIKEKFPWKLLLLIPYCYMGELYGFQRSPFSRKRSLNGNGLIKAPDFLICVLKQTIKTIKQLHKFALPPPLQIKMISLYC